MFVEGAVAFGDPIIDRSGFLEQRLELGIGGDQRGFIDLLDLFDRFAQPLAHCFDLTAPCGNRSGFAVPNLCCDVLRFCVKRVDPFA